MKKFISFLLCFILCFNLMPVITLAMFDNVFQIEFSGPPEEGTAAIVEYQINDGDWQVYNQDNTPFYHPGPEAIAVTEIKFKTTPPKDASNNSLGLYKVRRTEDGSDPTELSVDSGITYDAGSGVYSFSIMPTEKNEGQDYAGFQLDIFWTADEYNNPPGDGDPPPGETQYTITASAGEGGSISPLGIVTVEHGSNYTFTVTPDAMYVIQELIVDGSNEGPIDSYEFKNIQENHTIQAIFSLLPPEQSNVTLNYDTDKGSISINDYGEGNGAVLPFDDGETIDVEIEAGNGYKISAVTVNGVNHADFNKNLYSFQLEVTGNTTISVEFEPITYTVTAYAGENGTITPAGETNNIQFGSDLSFTIEPNNGYEIDEILVNDEPIEMNDFDRSGFTYDFHNINQNYTIHATFRQIGDGSTHTLTLLSDGNGIVTVDGHDGETFDIIDGFDVTLSITPNTGYSLSTVVVNGEDQGWNIEYKDDGTFEFTFPVVREDMAISVVFQAETLDGILSKSYAVLDEEAESEALIKAALIREFGLIQYIVSPDRINVSDIDLSGIETDGYGTFSFTVQVGAEVSASQTGYIVPEFSDVLFKYDGSYNGDPVNEIRIAHPQDAQNGMFSAPAMDSGIIDIFGLYNFHVEAWMSNDTRDAFGESQNRRLVVIDSFYRVNLHMGNTAMEYDKGLNWFGFDLIQDDAFCVKVDATSAEGTQHTLQWDLNRYAILNSDDYVSEVFFGNDTFEISIPEEGIGGITELTLETGDFQGYTIIETDPGREFEVFFKSDFYDRITLDITMNGNIVRPLTVHRVGVQIQKEEYNPGRGPNVNLFHGTQYSTRLDFSDGQHYRIYATYCIPDRGILAPYGLYVTYTYENGTKESRIITNPCDDPSPAKNAEYYKNGVFIYGPDKNNPGTACCDYLIYSAQDGTNAPVKINVTVLKGNPLAAGTFGGISFGSGAGVEWTDEGEDE